MSHLQCLLVLSVLALLAVRGGGNSDETDNACGSYDCFGLHCVFKFGGCMSCNGCGVSVRGCRACSCRIGMDVVRQALAQAEQETAVGR